MSFEALEELADLIAERLDRSPLRRYTTTEAAARLGLKSPKAAKKRDLNWKRDGNQWFCLEKDIQIYLATFHETEQRREEAYVPVGVSEETARALGLKS
jgi:hypothetical protein